jgi:uncharacterized membrane protein YdjX (TVP38/TMEM64 family)
VRWRTLWRLGRLGPAVLATAFLPPLGALVLLSTMHQSAPWLREQGVGGMALFVAAFTVLGGLALLPTYAPSVLGGWAFGVAAGLPVTLGGFLGAAALGYALARRLSGDRLTAVIDEHPRGHALRRALVQGSSGRTVLVVALLRLPPNAPFAMTNVLLAASGVAWGPYLLGGAFGLAPRVTAAVIVGSGLSRLELAHLERGGSVYLSITVSIMVLAVIGWLANRAIGRVAPES